MARPVRSSATKAADKIAMTNGASHDGATPKTRSRPSAGNRAEAKPKSSANPPPLSPKASKKRGREAVKLEAEDEEKENWTDTKKPTKRTKTTSKAQPKAKAKVEPDLEAGAKLAANISDAPVSTETPKKSKANPYNLSPGESPYPSYPHPTPEECQEVNDLLAAIHGKITAPKTISAPSLTSSGCGEVPSVLDALVRTRLSAATNNANSSRAFRGLVEKFGTLKEGVGKGSVDWNKVRKADVRDVFEAIKSGGLADVKSRDIKKILELVYAENEEARSNNQDDAPPAKVLSLDHLHRMTSDDAFNKLLGYPGIGPKTASCVLLFCMQRPSFAVDTHVFRLTKWLGWTPSDSQIRGMARDAGKGGSQKVKKEEDNDDAAPSPSPSKRNRAKPPPVTRNSTYSHLDVRIPDELKYPLHYLLIKHGKTCPSCTAKPDRAMKEAWGNKQCPIKHLKRGSKKKVLVESGEVAADEAVDDEGNDTGTESGDDSEEYAHGMKV